MFHRLVKKNVSKNVKYLLVQSFSDENPKVDEDRLEVFLKKYPMDFIQISVKENVNIIEAVEMIVRAIEL